MAAWFIDDLNEYQIYITDLWREFTLPKFRIDMTVSEPILTIRFNDREKGAGGQQRILEIDYRDVVDGYSGYVSNPSSAANLMALIEAMIVSAWTELQGDLLTAKGDLLTHDGVSDVIHPLGANERILSVNTANSDGLEWITKAAVVDGGLTEADTTTIDMVKSGSTISANLLYRSFAIVAFCNQAVADGATYFFNGSGTNLNAVAANQKNTYPPAGTMLGVHMEWMAYSTAGSNENISIYLRFNDTTDYLIATVGNTNFVKVFENLSLNGGAGVAFNGTTDFYCYKMVCPTWSNNPTTVGMQGYSNYKVS